MDGDLLWRGLYFHIVNLFFRDHWRVSVARGFQYGFSLFFILSYLCPSDLLLFGNWLRLLTSSNLLYFEFFHLDHLVTFLSVGNCLLQPSA